MATRVHSEANQYTYCAVCGQHHDQSRKHIFTKHHKEKLAGILAKLLEKVRNKLTYIVYTYDNNTSMHL